MKAQPPRQAHLGRGHAGDSGEDQARGAARTAFEAEREAAGIRPLPHSLGEALDLLEATPEARSWFGPVFLDAYLRHKRAEIRSLEGLDPAAQCARYALTY